MIPLELLVCSATRPGAWPVPTPLSSARPGSAGKQPVVTADNAGEPELAVDAIIVIIEVHLLDAATVFLQSNVHAVVVDSDSSNGYSVIDMDPVDGARKAVEHLLDLGHTCRHGSWSGKARRR